MARPKQCRKVFVPPVAIGFKPYGCNSRKQGSIALQYDEYEVVRLLDYEGKMQEEAAAEMNVSRPTLTRIYDHARKIIAQALVEGKTLEITGGNVTFHGAFQWINNSNKSNNMKQKIAIPTADGFLWPHFGKAPQVTFVTVEDGKVIETETLTAPEHAHGAMPRFMAAQGATDILCGGLGAGAVEVIRQLGLNLHAGAPAIAVEEVVKMYLDGTIVYGDSSCHHHCSGHDHDRKE